MSSFDEIFRQFFAVADKFARFMIRLNRYLCKASALVQFKQFPWKL